MNTHVFLRITICLYALLFFMTLNTVTADNAVSLYGYKKKQSTKKKNRSISKKQ
jgi:hypothetical protein